MKWRPGRRSLLTKLYIAMGMVALPLLLLHPLYVLPAVRAQLREDRVRTLRSTVETAYGVLETYAAKVTTGELSREQAQAQAAQMLQGLRYGKVEYFWVNDLSTRLVMHPYLPAMLGQDMTGYRDARGKAVFVDIVQLAQAQGEGAIAYAATRPGSREPIPKESYVKLFAPWGWVLGTGVYVEDIDKEMAVMEERLMVTVGAVLFLVAGVGAVFSRRVVKPVRALSEAAKRVAAGDLNVTVPVDKEDEVGQLGHAFNTMVTGIRETVQGIASVAVSTVANADRIRRSADVLSMGTRQRSEQMQMVADAVQEMSHGISQGAQQALLTAQAAENNGRVASEGNDAVERASKKISELVQMVHRAAQMVARLQASSEVVGQMLQLIEDISTETNILAINTAIEAARAGESGKGFGVVAAEVRKLAERSRDVVQQIDHLLKQNQEETTAAALQMRQGTVKVEEGVRLSTATAEALERIVSGAKEIQTRVGILASEGTRQSSSGQALAKRIHTISASAADAVSGMEQIAQSVLDLHTQAQHLWTLAERFSPPEVQNPTVPPSQNV
ncbi:cache domain-containing protein [Stigmatella sp. ncwal1]|uniref:Cache domain-containing protein n=1 Tax=Stigmatella ashevillensis TaxID=2995309 RepID=A0ABT5DEP7_9BACT|nr:methyl-accepting chemotaxis protein [Stigmatella ashevillena]MDC0712139.1 cache domain-containing protein [Stigmatella ashevillena]